MGYRFMRLRLEFNEIVIIESLPQADRQTGTELYEYLRSNDLAVSLLSATTAAEFLSTLGDIASHSESDGWTPFIHFELHGDAAQSSFVTASCERVAWAEVAAPLRRINIAVRNSLCVAMAVCSGAFVTSAVVHDPFEPAPFYWLIAPVAPVGEFFLRIGFRQFYTQLIATGQSMDAVDSLRQTTLPEYVDFDTATLFQTGWKELERTLDKRVEDELSQMSAERLDWSGGLDTARKMIATKVRAMYPREELYRRFIMADKYPENLARFPWSYEPPPW